MLQITEEGITKEEILGMMIEIEPLEREKFLLVRETLTRMGVPGRVRNGVKVLNQSVHVFHKRGVYYLAHFKHLFLLDGRFEQTEISDDDIDRLLLVAKLLKEWGLVVPKDEIDEPDLNFNTVNLTVIPHKDKSDWILEAKHSIGLRNYQKKEAK